MTVGPGHHPFILDKLMNHIVAFALTAKKKASARTPKPKPPPSSKPSAYRPQVTAEKEDDFMANLLSGVDTSTNAVASSSPISSGFRRKRKSSIDAALDSGSITNPSSDPFEVPSSDSFFQDSVEASSRRDYAPWEMRGADSSKKARLGASTEDSSTPRNARKGVSFADDMELDDNHDIGDDTIVKDEEVDQEDDDEDFLVRSDRVIAARANQSKARDRLMTAIGANKMAESTTTTTTAKSRRAMVNGSAISTKLEAEKIARMKAEELASINQMEAVAAVKTESNGAEASTKKQSWRNLQETLNTGNLNDDSLGTPFTPAAAAQKKYIPTLRVDAFEQLEENNDSSMDTDSDGEHSDSSLKARRDRRSKFKNGQATDPGAEHRLKFYWLDYLEQDGLVHLLGKTFDRSSDKYVSCCVTITGIQRNLFILPRDRRLGKSLISLTHVTLKCSRACLLQTENTKLTRMSR